MGILVAMSTVSARKLRSDTQRTRDRLLDAMASLLRERGLDFSLPDLAREAGVAVATVYRHFGDLGDLRQEFYSRFVDSLLGDLAALLGQFRGHELFRAACETWVRTSLPVARACTFIRSAEGYLERVRSRDPFVAALHEEVLVPILDQLIEDGVVPDQDRAYAALSWITLFDERVIIDLTIAFGWDEARVAAALGDSLLAVLRGGALTATAAGPAAD